MLGFNAADARVSFEAVKKPQRFSRFESGLAKAENCFTISNVRHSHAGRREMKTKKLFHVSMTTSSFALNNSVAFCKLKLLIPSAAFSINTTAYRSVSLATS